jgi:hypothetical protein
MKNNKKFVWCNIDNEYLTRTSFHCYTNAERGPFYNRHEGNKALCNKRHGVSDDGENFIPIHKLKGDPFDETRVCKSCLKLYKKYNNV